MKKTFDYIRKGNIDEIKKILDDNPYEINAVAKQPPKKDDGQSLLQVAIKNGQFEIANLLLDYGVDVNFIESEDCCNEWRMPVLHDSIRAAVMCSRWNVKNLAGLNYVEKNSKEKSDEAYNLLERIINLGADINCKDSYNNTILDRAILDAIQILPAYNYQTNTISDNRKLTDNLRCDLNRIFMLLYKNGASVNWVNNTGKSINECYKKGNIVEFINLDILDKKKII